MRLVPGLATRLAGLVGATLLGSACAPQVTSIGEWSPGPEAFYWEAEAGELSAEFVVVPDSTASSGEFLAPPELTSDELPGDARARYRFSVVKAAEFVLWGRIRSPDAGSNRFWVKLDQGEWHKWRISVGDIWYWDDVHDDAEYGAPLMFELAPGAHELTVANCVGGAALDRLYLTAAGDAPPGNDTECNPPHSIERGGTCLPSCGSQAGTMCGVMACNGREILEAYDCDVCCRDTP